MADETTILESGSVFSHFRLKEKLGQGGMGAVYLAEDLTLSRSVAIKIMNSNLLDVEEGDMIEQRFIREAKLAASINHVNIVQVYEANFVSDPWFIAMEYIEGNSLGSLLKSNGPFTAISVMNLLDQVCKGLQYAWEKYHVVHRDIKPQNLMLNNEGTVKIVDLGLAKPIIEAGEDEYELTGGMPIGTPYYMAPEQTLAEDIDHRCDIFSLGTTIYQLLSGKHAFKGKTPIGIYNKKVAQKYERLSEDIAPKELSAIIEKMMKPDLEERYATYGELISDVKELQKQYSEDEIQANEETILSTAPLARDTMPASDVSSPVPSNFDRETLKALAAEMAVFIGPVAKLVVKKKAKKSDSINQLIDKLCKELETDAEKTQFRKRVKKFTS